MKILKFGILIFSLLFVLGCKKENQINDLLTEIEILKTENDSLSQLIFSENPESNYWFDSNYEGREFNKAGISDPAEFIEEQLREKPELIPVRAVLGGTMRFVKIQLLSSEWLIASFEDGHIQGRALYKYKLNKEGKLEFELLSFLDSE